MKLLIVDDSTIIRQFIQKIVTAASLDIEIVGEAGDGERALKAFDELQPDIVTMDITMPNMDGLTCMRTMLKRVPTTKVIVVTALHSTETQLKALEQGAVAFLNKPVQTEQLKEVFEDLLSK